MLNILAFTIALLLALIILTMLFRPHVVDCIENTLLCSINISANATAIAVNIWKTDYG